MLTDRRRLHHLLHRPDRTRRRQRLRRRHPQSRRPLRPHGEAAPVQLNAPPPPVLPPSLRHRRTVDPALRRRLRRRQARLVHHHPAADQLRHRQHQRPLPRQARAQAASSKNSSRPLPVKRPPPTLPRQRRRRRRRRHRTGSDTTRASSASPKTAPTPPSSPRRPHRRSKLRSGQIAVQGANNLYVYDANTGETKFVTELCSGPETVRHRLAEPSLLTARCRRRSGLPRQAQSLAPKENDNVLWLPGTQPAKP